MKIGQFLNFLRKALKGNKTRYKKIKSLLPPKIG